MSTISFASSLVRAVLGVALMATTAAAQDSSAHSTVEGRLSALARRSAGNVSVVQSRPQGAFGRNVGLGYGVDGAYLLRLDDAGFLSLRLSGGMIRYGPESRRTAISEAIGGRVQVDVKTANYIAPMSIGPQVAWPTGPIRPYVNVGVGGLAFFTESHLEDTHGYDSFASTTNHSSFAAAWSVGSGVYLPVRLGKTNVQLDVGMQYLNGGNARYLAPGSIVDLPDARISVAPLESPTHLVVLRFGTRIGL